MDDVRIRGFEKADARAAARVLYDSVHGATASAYDAAERRAWAPEPPDGPTWLARLSGHTTLVAERAGMVIGFMSLSDDGCIDLAYVAPGDVGTGVGGRLYDAIVAEARRRGLTALRTDASHIARPFFERRGWAVVRRRTVERNGVTLINFLMRGPLA